MSVNMFQSWLSWAKLGDLLISCVFWGQLWDLWSCYPLHESLHKVFTCLLWHLSLNSQKQYALCIQIIIHKNILFYRSRLYESSHHIIHKAVLSAWQLSLKLLITLNFRALHTPWFWFIWFIAPIWNEDMDKWKNSIRKPANKISYAHAKDQLESSFVSIKWCSPHFIW